MCPPPATTTDAVSVLIADSSHMQAQLLRGALRRRADFHIATCRMEATSLLHAVAAASPTVTLLSPDPSSRLGDVMALVRRFHLSHPEVVKVLLVAACDRELTVSAFRSGARGIFCLTDASLRLLRKCVLSVAKGQIWANTEQMNYLLDLIAEVPSLRILNVAGEQLLTPREQQVVALVAEGFGNREIARELDLSEHTIKKYLFRIFDKLGISTRVELVLYAMNHGDRRSAEWLAGARRTLSTA